MEKKYAKRLLKLADFLETLPTQCFNYSTYGERAGCGTAGCAIGWACAMPSFKKFGVEIYDPTPARDFSHLHAKVDGAYSSFFGAAVRLFNVTRDQYDKLFIPGFTGGDYSGLPGNASPDAVAAHIRTKVAEWCPEAVS